MQQCVEFFRAEENRGINAGKALKFHIFLTFFISHYARHPAMLVQFLAMKAELTLLN